MNTTTPQPTFSGGELVAGKYRVERIIGEGGMGVVVAARHEALGTSVAIKLLRAQALGHTDVVGRFMREARASVSLKSEHVARVFDVGNLDDGRPYIVMERLEGKDLGAVIDESSPIAIQDAVDYVLQACEAIAEAHAAGIIHRDLKPTNLFLTRTVHGRPLVKVLDFGISKVAQSSPDEMQLTKTAEIIGSPSYMSPEQLRSSRNVDVRTDIWALGVILYELLTGRVPFLAEAVTELVLMVFTEREPPVHSFRPDVPEGLEAIIARCMQKQPEQRFQTVLELVQALEPYSQSVASTASDRIRAVSGARGAGPTSGAPPVVSSAAPSSRVNVHGGTSVAWGETQPLASAQTNGHVPSPTPLFRRPVIMLGAAALLISGLALGAVGLLRKPAQPPGAAAESNLPLPSGRKDLPPVPPPSSASPLVSAATPEPPAASALPETRKPPPSPATKASPPKATPAPKADDLSNIGRR